MEGKAELRDYSQDEIEERTITFLFKVIRCVNFILPSLILTSSTDYEECAIPLFLYYSK